MRKTFTVFALAVMLVLTAGLISATPSACNGNPGDIKTTTSPCGATVNENHYVAGEHVYIHATGFCPNTEYDWDITGVGGEKGGASCDSSIIVASGTKTTDGNGDICFDAYTITDNNCGEYKATFDGKHDNYNVVPEFGLFVAGLTIFGALGVFFLVRRK